MSTFFFELLLFSSKAFIICLAIVIVVLVILTLSARIKEKLHAHIQLIHLNKDRSEIKAELLEEIVTKKQFKQFIKENKKHEKKWMETSDERKRIFCIQFQGDIQASANTNLVRLVNAILSIARPQDEVILDLESSGGMVHAYGLATAQLMRFRAHGIRLTACIDNVAASGGYMMACVADRILAAPYAIIGSIGVVMQLPNFNRWLKEHHIDFELQTAGEYKRTLTVFGENTDLGREKVREELDITHQLFKELIQEHRPQINLSDVATGEHWCAKQALTLNLVDGIQTFDDYVSICMNEADVYQLKLSSRKTLFQKLMQQSNQVFNFILNLITRSASVK